MFTIAFWKGAAERAIKTFIQSFVATLLASIGAVVSAWEVPWETALSASLGVAVLSTVLSLATSIGNADFTAGPQKAIIEYADANTQGRHEATDAYPVAEPHRATETDPERYV